MLSFKVYIALFLAVALTIVDAAPFNAVGPFYNGNAASAPSFDIQVQLRLRGMSVLFVYMCCISLYVMSIFSGAPVARPHREVLQPRRKIDCRDRTKADVVLTTSQNI